MREGGSPRCRVFLVLRPHYRTFFLFLGSKLFQSYFNFDQERWLSGRKQRFAKSSYPTRVPGVRIPLSPPLLRRSSVTTYRLSHRPISIVRTWVRTRLTTSISVRGRFTPNLRLNSGTLVPWNSVPTVLVSLSPNSILQRSAFRMFVFGSYKAP